MKQSRLALLCCLVRIAVASADNGISYSRDSSWCQLHGNRTVNCTSLVTDFSENWKGKDNCTFNYYKLNLRVKKAFNRSETRQCVQNNYTLTCATIREIQKDMVKKELCHLNVSGLAHICKSNVTIFNISKSQPSFYSDKYDVRIEPSSLRENLHWAMSAARFKGKKEPKLLNEKSTKLKMYNHFVAPENSTVVVLLVLNETAQETAERVVLTIKTPETPFVGLSSVGRIIDVNKICVYLDISEKEGDKWDDTACSKGNSPSDSKTVCICKHNSAFAVVFAVTSVDINSSLQAVSDGLEIASVVILFITAVLLGVYRKRMRNFDRVLVQLNLCIALMLAHLCFVIGPLALDHENFCKAIAVGSHYFLVTTAVLMVMEGTLMIVKVLAPNSMSNSAYAKRRRILGFLVGWGLPLIYVAVCSAVGFSNDSSNGTETKNNYIPKIKERGGRYEYCWINNEYVTVVIVPVAIALTINIAIAIRLGALVWKMSISAEEYKPSNLRDMNKATHAGKALRAVAILMPILGIPWILGFLVNISKFANVFASIHVVVNSLQGVLLFLHYVVFNSEMRTSIQRFWKSTISNVATITPTVHFTSKEKSDSVTGLKGD